MPWLINAAQLDKFRKGQKNVTILDVTCRLPQGREAKAEFEQHHIAGAQYLDLDLFADKNTPLPNMLTRDEDLVSQLLGSLGITSEHKIIFYDNSPLHVSCRALWMFKVFGHNPQQLYILDGGYDTWEKFGGKIETGPARTPPAKTYPMNFEPHYVRTLVQMKTNLHHPTEQVIDTRHPVRFAGGPEQRPGLRAGHIPGSFCFPYTSLFEADGRWKPLEKLRKQIAGIGVDLKSPIVTTCGSGTTAPILNFVLDLLDAPQNALYDGSWSEWGAETLYHGEANLNERPIATSLDT